MNDEIKEILNKLQYGFCSELTYEKLLDYITNLQQENERLKKDNKILKQNNINEVLRNDFDMCVKDLKKANKKIEKLEDYKSRIEKAIEYIKEKARNNCWIDQFEASDLIKLLRGENNE